MNRRELFKGLFGGALLGLMPRGDASVTRVSCLRDDPGFRSDHWKFRAFIDGEYARYCQTASEVSSVPGRGFVVELARENGRFVIVDNAIVTNWRYGVVKIVRVA